MGGVNLRSFMGGVFSSFKMRSIFSKSGDKWGWRPSVLWGFDGWKVSSL